MYTGKYQSMVTETKKDPNKRPRYYSEEAWMKMLRSTNPTKKVYDVDPYVEVYQFRDNLYGLLSSLIDAGGFVWMWLIIGPEKAMLIDTSFGIGNLKGLVDEITGGMPLIVANTHCSCDHSYGNCQFDRTYCHKDLVADLNWKQDPRLWDYLINEDGSYLCVEFDKKDIIPFKKYEVVGVPNGYRFDLGKGYEVELMWTPAHQPGHAAYLDRQGRFLIGGDALSAGSIAISGGSDFHADQKHARDLFQGSTIPTEDPRRTVTAERDGLKRLAEHLDEFDSIFCGHGIQDFDSKLILDQIETCNQIIAHPDEFDFEEGDGRHCARVKGGGHICYYKDGI